MRVCEFAAGSEFTHPHRSGDRGEPAGEAAAPGARELNLIGNRLFKSGVQRHETGIVFDTVKAGPTIPLG